MSAFVPALDSSLAQPWWKCCSGVLTNTENHGRAGDQATPLSDHPGGPVNGVHAASVPIASSNSDSLYFLMKSNSLKSAMP